MKHINGDAGNGILKAHKANKIEMTKSIMQAYKDANEQIFELTGKVVKTDTMTISSIAKKLDSIETSEGSLFDAIINSSSNIRKYILLNISEIHDIMKIATDDTFEVKETAILAVVFRIYCFNFSM